MLYKFHIIGFAQVGIYQYDNNCPIDITVYSDTESNALDKVKSVLGYTVAKHSRKIVVEETLEQDTVRDTNAIKQKAYKEFAAKFKDKIYNCPYMIARERHGYYYADVHKCIDKTLKALENN